jgi:hypothetical protein
MCLVYHQHMNYLWRYFISVTGFQMDSSYFAEMIFENKTKEVSKTLNNWGVALFKYQTCHVPVLILYQKRPLSYLCFLMQSVLFNKRSTFELLGFSWVWLIWFYKITNIFRAIWLAVARALWLPTARAKLLNGFLSTYIL